MDEVSKSMESLQIIREFCQLPDDCFRNLIPIGDWGAGWGPLCIDLSRPEGKIDPDDPALVVGKPERHQKCLVQRGQLDLVLPLKGGDLLLGDGGPPYLSHDGLINAKCMIKLPPRLHISNKGISQFIIRAKQQHRLIHYEVSCPKANKK